MKRKIRGMKEYTNILSDKEINQDLENIYEDENGEMPSMFSLEPKKRSRLMRFLIYLGVILLLIVIVAWSGFYLFNRYAPESVQKFLGDDGKVKIEIQAAKDLESGQEITYLIKYKNDKKVAINNVQLNVRYPSGLLISEITPQPRAKGSGENYLAREDDWDLGSLDKGGEGEIKIVGKLVAEMGTNQNLWAVLYYEPANFTSKFQAEASFSTEIKSVPVAVTITGPENLPPSQLVELILAYANKSDGDLKDVMIEVIYPEKFNLESVEPAANQGNNTWQFADFNKDQQGEIKILGKFAASVMGSQEFIVKTLLKDNEPDYYLLEEQSWKVEVVKGDLVSELKINSSPSDGSIGFGDTLNYTLTFENDGSQTIKDLTVSVFFTPTATFIDWSTLNDRYEGTLDEFEAGKLITWTKDEVPNLDELKPGDKGVIDFSVKIVSNAGNLSGDLSLQSIASTKLGEVGGKEANVENKSNKIITKVNSNLSLDAYARYFDDSADAIGAGPLPPRVDQATTYVINWVLSNSVHEVQDIVVSTVLPEKVSWVGKKDISVGDLEYQPEDHKVVWTINRIPTAPSLDVRVSFRVSIKPVASDLGKVLVLTGNNSIAALDKDTGVALNKTLGSITTDLA
ncbi:MAG: hypothetical protein WC480_01500, partial [Patescibacteria group bacterium]